MSSGRSFSLLSMLIIVTLAGSVVGLFAMHFKVVRAETARDLAVAERDELRSKFGYIDVDDESITYFARINSHESEDTYRAIFPAGSRYLLHVSDTPMKNSEIPEELPRTKSLSMNSWRQGADVILKWSVQGGDKKRFVVSTLGSELINYEIENWTNPGGHPNEASDLDASPQVSFPTDERVILSYFGNSELERGIVIWLEPHSMWEQRERQR